MEVYRDQDALHRAVNDIRAFKGDVKAQEDQDLSLLCTRAAASQRERECYALSSIGRTARA